MKQTDMKKVRELLQLVISQYPPGHGHLSQLRKTPHPAGQKLL